MDSSPLRHAFRTFLDAATTVAGSGDTSAVAPVGEWNADQILAHISLVSAAAIATVSAVAAGGLAMYDNRTAHDAWTIERVIALAGGTAGLQHRIHRQGDALCALGGAVLTEAELDTLVPVRLLSNGTVLVDQPMSLRDIITGLTDVELPGHANQLLALLPVRQGASK